jgi:hypothetical protein
MDPNESVEEGFKSVDEWFRKLEDEHFLERVNAILQPRGALSIYAEDPN